MKNLSSILRVFTVLSGLALMTLCGILAIISWNAAADADNAVVLYHKGGVFDTSPPGADTDETYTELSRETNGEIVTVLEIGKKDDGIFYQHMVYDAVRKLYPEGYVVSADAKIVSLSEIREGILSFAPIAVLVPLFVFTLFASFLLGNGISHVAERKKSATRWVAVSAALLLLLLGALYLVSSQIHIPNSLLPSENIFDASHYQALYASVREMAQMDGAWTGSFVKVMERLPILFTLFQAEIIVAICFTVFTIFGFRLKRSHSVRR